MSKDKPPLTDKISEFHAILPSERKFFNLKSPVCLLCAKQKAFKWRRYVPRDEKYKIEKENLDNSLSWKWVFTYLFTIVKWDINDNQDLSKGVTENVPQNGQGFCKVAWNISANL